MDHERHAHHDPSHPSPDGGGAHGSHDQHAGHSVAMFRDRFWLSVLLTIPVLVWSEMVQDWLGFTAPTFPLSASCRSLDFRVESSDTSAPAKKPRAVISRLRT